jgi:hypothetical protein
MGRETMLRVEESASPNKPAIEAINDVFNPYERIEGYLTDHTKKLTELSNQVYRLTIRMQLP